MGSSIREILVGLTEAENMKKSKEFIASVVDERAKGKISKALAREILSTIYQEDTTLKQEIWDSVEAKIGLDQNLARKK